MGLIFSDFEIYSKSAPGKISLSIVLVLYTYEIGKTAKKTQSNVVLTLDRLSDSSANQVNNKNELCPKFPDF